MQISAREMRSLVLPHMLHTIRSLTIRTRGRDNEVEIRERRLSKGAKLHNVHFSIHCCHIGQLFLLILALVRIGLTGRIARATIDHLVPSFCRQEGILSE